MPLGQPTSQRIQYLLASSASFWQFMKDEGGPYLAAKRADGPICDFLTGNPQEMPIDGLVPALLKACVPQEPSQYGYQTDEPNSQNEIQKSVKARLGLDVAVDDIHLTNGALAGIAVVLNAVADAYDQVLYISPTWYFYEPLILTVGSAAVRVRMQGPDFRLDVDAIREAITPRTRAIIINTPNNPTGRVYSEDELRRLADALTEESARNGRTIYLLSDEAYSRIVFDDRQFHSPVEFYPDSFLIYSYSKTLLAPGHRLAYVALPETTDKATREELRNAIELSQVLMGWCYPSTVMQRALADLDNLCIDVHRIQARRDRLVKALGDQGYELQVPEGTLYILVRSPWKDDRAFCKLLAGLHTTNIGIDPPIYVWPGYTMGAPGYFRISLSGTDAMVDQSLSGFERAMEYVLQHP